MLKKLYLLCSLFLFAPTLMWANMDNQLVQIAQEFIIRNNPWLSTNQNGLVLQSEKQSPIGTHLLFIQQHQGVRVYDADIKINLNSKGVVLSVFNNLKPIEQLLPMVTPSAQTVYFFQAKKWYIGTLSIQPNKNGERFEWVHASNGEVLFFRLIDLRLRKDSLVQSKVFLPDPITSSGKTYGQNGLYKNNSGADAAELTAELKNVNLTLGFSNDTFYTSSPYVIIKDLESPANTVFRSTTPNFNFTRSQAFFREMNCLYHIETFRTYLNGIGLPFTGMPPILLDPTAYQGQDQSRFSYSNTNEPALFFGTGGVPDAEDADVIVHEYTHGLNNFIAPNSTSGNERLAVEEANCDFMACQYSRAVNPFNYRLVFNWDGHNEFWNGRDANSDNTYPDDLSADFYVSSLIWSSMLNDLGEELGRDVMSKLLFQSVYSYANYMTMQQAANLLMQTDSLLYGYKHFDGLRYHLEKRGFLVYTGLSEKVPSAPFVQMLNSEGFAKGESMLMVRHKQQVAIDVKIYDSKGSLVNELQSANGQLDLAAGDFVSGVYFMYITDVTGNVARISFVRN